MLHPQQQILAAIKAAKQEKNQREGRSHSPRRKFNHSAGWALIGDNGKPGKGNYYRSMWERNFARYLQYLKEHNEILEWEYEKDEFWFEKERRGVRSYLIDFTVTNVDGSKVYYEVKGFLDQKSKTKIKRLAKYFPHVLLKVINSKWWSQIGNKIGPLIAGWEKA